MHGDDGTCIQSFCCKSRREATRKEVTCRSVDCIQLPQSSMVCYCGEYGNKFSHSIEGREFLEQLGGL
jgi:hypothetical protein